MKTYEHYDHYLNERAVQFWARTQSAKHKSPRDVR